MRGMGQGGAKVRKGICQLVRDGPITWKTPTSGQAVLWPGYCYTISSFPVWSLLPVIDCLGVVVNCQD